MDYQHGSGSGNKASMLEDKSVPPPYQEMPQMGQFAAYPQQPYQGQPYPGQPYPGQQPYSNQAYPFPAPTVINVQPNAPLSPPENEYLGYSIFTLLCCFLPLGIAALIHSFIVSRANTRGDRAEAVRASRLARILNHTALGLGILLIVIVIITLVVILT